MTSLDVPPGKPGPKPRRAGFVIVLADGVTIVVVSGAVVSVRYQGEAPPRLGLAQEMSPDAVKKRFHEGNTGR